MLTSMDAALQPHLPLLRPASSPPVTLTQPGEDVLERLLQTMAAALLHAAQARRSSRLARDQRRQCRLAEQLSPALLRDIGAPDWLQLEARAWRRAEGDRLEALRRMAASGP